MMNNSVGIRSLAVSFPSVIRTNEYWEKKYPELFARAKPRTVRVSKFSDNRSNYDRLNLWSMGVAPYLSDPFRGNVERRVLGVGESSFTLEYSAAKDALEAAQISPERVELMIVASLFGEYTGSGHASYLAQELKLHCPAWNLESTCSSASIALQNACALIQTETYRNILVVVSQIGSNTTDEKDTLSLSMGDGAGAFLVDSLQATQGILGTKIINTAVTHGAYLHELKIDPQGKPRLYTRMGENASMLAETAVDFVRTCTYGAVDAAGLTLDDIDFFAFNTPTAWYADICTSALGIDPQRVINLYPRYANIGPVFPIANLYHAAEAGKIRENNLVLVYSNGAAATAVATVMRWGNVGLGQVPTDPINVTQDQEKINQLQVNSVTKSTKGLLREKLLTAHPDERLSLLETYIEECLIELLQLSSIKLNKHQPLASMLDSLMVLVLKSKIEADLQIRVPIDKFFGEQNITHLVETLLNQLALANLVETADRDEEQEREKLIL